MGNSAKIRHRRARRARRAQAVRTEAQLRELTLKLGNAIDDALARAACFMVRVVTECVVRLAA